MKRITTYSRFKALAVFSALGAFLLPGMMTAEEGKEKSPLKIGYTDWPGWVIWDVAQKKDWFEEAGVNVEFLWFDYVGGLDAYAAGQLDAYHMTNGDGLVISVSARRAIGIIITDYSNGADMVVAAEGIDSMKDLEGKKVGLQVGFLSHHLFLKGAKENGVDVDKIEFVDVPPEESPAMLQAGAVSAISAWQPNSGTALKLVPGSKAIYTSADAPGIIYDMLYVSPESLKERKEDWEKVVDVWYRLVDYVMDEDNFDEVVRIGAARMNLTPAEFEPLLDGVKLLTREEALEAWEKGNDLSSIYGSSEYVDAFNVSQGVYEEEQDVSKFFDPSLTE